MVVDPNNQQYYDLGAPAPAPAPWYKQRQVQQKLFIGVLVGLLVMFGSYLILRYILTAITTGVGVA